MSEPLQVLILDDSEDDALLLIRTLRAAGLECAWRRADTADGLSRALDQEEWDVVLADYRIPGFGGLEATRWVRERDPDLPIIMVSGKVGEEVTADVLRAGARDMVIKDRLERLAPAVRREIEEARSRRAGRAVRLALRESEERLRLLARATNEVHWDWSVREDRIWWGGDVHGYFGYRPEELGEAFDEWIRLLHPDDRIRVMSDLDRWLESGEDQWSAEFRMRRADGSWAWILDRAFAIRDAEGDPVRAVGTLLDVTPMRRVQESLQARTAALGERVKELRTLYRVSDVLLAGDQDGRCAWQRVVDLLPGGWQYPEITVARIIADGEVHRSPGFRETPWTLSAEIPGGEGVAPGRIQVVYLEERPDADRGPFLREEVDLLHEVAKRVGDTLGRRRAEEETERSEMLHRALTENSTDLVSIVEEDGTIRYESPSLRRILGYDPEELVGAPIAELIHPEDWPAVRDAIESARRDPERTPVIQYRARHRDGTWRHLESTGRNLVDEPAVRGFVTNTRDVTERKELEARLLQAQKMEAVGRLAGGIAHDFNNLLTVIRGNVELIHSGLPPDDPRRADLVEVLGAAVRAADLTRSLLAFSRRQPADARTLDVGALLTEMEPVLHRVLGDDVDLVTSVAADLAPLRGDPGQLEQVLVNLAANARDAMPDGGALRISARNVDVEEGSDGIDGDGRRRPAGRYVMLSVADTGTGMPEEVRRKAFEPFFTTRENGTGLGLATVFGVVNQSGGDIVLHSEVGEGTTVQIFFPARAAEKEALRSRLESESRAIRLP